MLDVVTCFFKNVYIIMLGLVETKEGKKNEDNGNIRIHEKI